MLPTQAPPPTRAPLAALLMCLAGCSSDLEPLLLATVDDDPTLPFADVNGTRLHLETFGAPADPTVFLLHGGPGGDHRGLLPMSALAERGYFVVAFDQRGSGLSRRHPCNALGAAEYLADLEALVDRFAPPGHPLLFVGHSFGAMYATWYMDSHPERATAAVLIEPGGLTADEVADYMGRLIGAAALSERMGDALWLGRMVTPDDHPRADLMTAVLFDASGPALGNDAEDPMPAWRAGGRVATCLPAAAGDFDWTRQLERVTASLLYLHGDRNTVSPPERQREIAAHYPAPLVEEVPGAGHDLHWSHRALIVPRVAEFFGAALAARGLR